MRQDDFNQAQQDVLNRLGRKLIEVIEKYSKENGYGIILDTSSQQTPVMYAANQIDITQDIVRLYDQSYPVKASTGAPTSRPAPKPAPVAPAALRSRSSRRCGFRIWLKGLFGSRRKGLFLLGMRQRERSNPVCLCGDLRI